MHVTFRCPRCEQTCRVLPAAGATRLECPQCDARMDVGPAARDGDHLNQCLVCGSRELFVRKDFPQRLGLLLVVVGFVASSVAWFYYQIVLAFGILFLTAGIDVVLYVLMGEALVCYRCEAHYRQVGDLGGHAAFDLETHERYRQIAARLSETKS